MKKYLLIALLFLTMTLVACGSGEDKDTDVKNPATDQTEVEVPEDPVKPDNTEKPVEPDDTEEPVEPAVEMLDFETWAKQEGNEDVCLVIWNEELNIQEVMPTVYESGKPYEVQEGDRFGVPYRENIEYVNILYQNGEIEILTWENSEYMEISLEIGKFVDVLVGYKNESGQDDYMYYAFK